MGQIESERGIVVKKIPLYFSNNYRWMFGNRYISNRMAWILIDVLKIAECENDN